MGNGRRQETEESREYGVRSREGRLQDYKIARFVTQNTQYSNLNTRNGEDRRKKTGDGMNHELNFQWVKSIQICENLYYLYHLCSIKDRG